MTVSRRMTPSSTRGFSLIELVIILGVIGIIGALSYVAYQTVTGSNEPDGSRAEAGAQCALTDGVNFCVRASDTSVSPTDDLSIKATLTNRTNETYETEAIYSSSCNAPSLTINDKEVMNFGACTTDITAIRIGAGETKEYTVAVDITKLTLGENTVKLAWSGDKLKSKPITITLTEATAADTAKSASCLGEQVARPYCSNVMIVFSQYSAGEESAACKQLESYVEPLGLKAVQEDCGLSDLGILSVYVPKGEKDEWIRKITQIPQVQSASEG